MPGEFDVNRMREEAAQRMREMQQRARAPAGRSHQSRREPPAQEAPAPPPETKPPKAEPPEPEPPQADPSFPQAQAGESVLNALFQDREKTIILALLILLGSEEGNHELMFALLFLLL